jgi:hypothetical protein
LSHKRTQPKESHTQSFWRSSALPPSITDLEVLNIFGFLRNCEAYLYALQFWKPAAKATEWRGMMRSRLIVVAAIFWLFQIGVSAQEARSASAARIDLKTAANLDSQIAAIDAMTANEFAKQATKPM